VNTPASSPRNIEKPPSGGGGNFWLHVGEGSLATLSGELVSMGVVLPVLADALGASPSTLGLVTSVAGFASLGPLIFASRMEAVRRKKRLVLFIGAWMRLPLLVIVLSLWLFGRSEPGMCLALIALSYLAAMLATNVNAPPWMDLLAETIPECRLGRLMGYRHGVSAAIGLFLAGPLTGTLIAAFAFPGNYIALYLAAFCAGLVSWLIFSLVDEVPEHVQPNGRQRTREYLGGLVRAARRDRGYRNLLVYKAVSQAGYAAMPFFTLAAVRVYGIDEAVAAGSFIAAGAAGRIGGNFAFARLSDRAGHRRVLALGALLLAAAALLAAFAPSGMSYVGVLFLWGLGMAARSVSDVPFVTALAPRGRRVGYISLMMVVITPMAVAAPLAAGNVMQTFGHTTLFVGTAVCLVLALRPLSLAQPARNTGDLDPSRLGQPHE